MRIGMIAMSGLRLCKPELLELGFSFPRVASRAKQIEALPTLGLLTLAGMTPPHIEVEYLEVRDVDHDELPTRYDAVAISALTAVSKEAYRLSRRFREQGIPVVLGGLHATMNPEDAIPHVDAVAIGEGELIWPQIVKDLESNQLKRIYDSKTSGSYDLAHAPMPRFDLLSADRYPRLSIQTQRGCPWSCEFCASSIRLSPKFKVKPVEKVVAEIQRLKELFGRPFVEFADDNTFVNRKHAKALMRVVAKEDIRWFTESDISIADDEELLGLMRDAGCAQVLIGFEHPTRSALDGVEQNNNWKAKSVSSYHSAVEKIQRHGITVNGCFVLGLDGTGTESVRDIVQFVKDSGLYDVQITYLTPFPGTPLYDRFKREGRILDADASEKCTLFDVNFQPDSMSVTELENTLLSLAGLLYSDHSVMDRFSRFKTHLRKRIASDRSAVRVCDSYTARSQACDAAEYDTNPQSHVSGRNP